MMDLPSGPAAQPGADQDTQVMTVPAWPWNGGEMAARIREYDWPATLLGPVEGWPQSLKAVVDLMLSAPQLATLAVGPDRIFLYNDQASRYYGERHPSVLGRPLADAFPHEFSKVAPFYDRVFAGEGIHVPAQPLDPAQTGLVEVFDAHLSPVRDGDGRVIAAYMTGSAASERQKAETRLRESEARQALLLRLGDAIRTVSDPAEIQQIAMRLLGEHLGLSRTYYFDVVRENGGWVHVIDDAWQRAPDGLSMVGRHALADFGDRMFEGFARGEVIVAADIDALLIITPEELASYRALGVTAFVNVPLLRNGEYSAGIGAHDTRPHVWTAGEIDLIREVAMRTWTAVERAQAEEALSKSEERYRSLFNVVNQGLAVNQLVRDGDGRVIDARFLDLNPAHEAHAGLSRAETIGRLASDVVPFLDRAWFEVAERVVETGQAERYESFVPGLERWFSFDMARFQGRDRFAVVYEDITERKLAESTLRENQEWQTFLLKLSDDIRAQSDEDGIGALVTRGMAEHLHLDRCYLAQLYPEEDRVIVGPEYHRPTLGPANGEYRLSDFPEVVRRMQTQTVVVDDVSGDPALTEFDKAGLKAIDIEAFITAGVRQGSKRVLWALVVMSAVPRAWAPGDVALVENVAERSWAAIERSRNEAALRESQEILAADLVNAELLRDLAERLVTEENVETIYDEILSAATVVAQADGGTVQTYDADTNSLYLLTTQSFSRTVVDRFHKVDASSKTACGVALRTGRRAFVDFEGEAKDPGCLLLVDAGFRTALAIPLVSRTGKKLGMLNTHWHAAGHRSDQRQLRFLELIARQTADLIEQRQAQSDLRESKSRLALAFNTLPLGIAILDVLGGVETANGEMRRFLPTGLIPSRDSGRSARWRGWHFDGRVASPEDYPGAQALRGSAVSPGMQMLYRDDSDRETYAEVLSAPLRDDDGRVSGAIVVVVDVDRAKRSEEAARASEERLRQFGETSQDILWIRDAETLQWTYLTPAFEAIYGLSREEALTGDNYRVWQDLIVPEDQAHAVASIGRVGAGEHVTFEYRIRRPVDGQVRWLRDTDFPMHDASGRVLRIGGVGHDVTELKAIQAAMAESETRLRTLTEGIPQLVWRSCAKGLWTWCSPQWMAFTGQTQTESHGLGWIDVVHPDDRVIAMQAWDDAQLHGRLDVECRVRRAADGAWLWHRTRSVPVRNPAEPDGTEGAIIEWLGTTTDIDDLKRLQAEQQVLVAELQHRTRNLLAVVRNVARRSIGPSPERDEYDARLGALGRVQGFLSRSPGYSVPLRDLVEAELHAVGDGASDKVAIAGPAVDLPGESVQVVALALHELATNAVKYGAIAQLVAQLSVTWFIEVGLDAAPRLVIDWRESGVMMPPGPPARRGYGSELITRALPYQLRAETALEFTPDGVRCRITLPASAFNSRTQTKLVQ